MIFLFNWVIFRFQLLIFRGVFLSIDPSFRTCHVDPSWADHSKTCRENSPFRHSSMVRDMFHWNCGRKATVSLKKKVHYSPISKSSVSFLLGKMNFEVPILFRKLHVESNRVSWCKDIVAGNVQMGDTKSGSLIQETHNSSCKCRHVIQFLHGRLIMFY